MLRPILATALLVQALLVQAAPALAPTVAPPDPAADAQCAVTVAIAAAEQDRGNPAVSGLPPLGARGRRYFAQVGNALAGTGQQSREQVRDALAAEALNQRGALGKADAPEFGPRLTAAFARCRPRLDAAVPPLVEPDLAQCAALAALGTADRRAAEGDTAEVRALDAIAFALAGQQRRMLAAQGMTASAIERALAADRADMARAVEADGFDHFDFDHCGALAESRPAK